MKGNKIACDYPVYAIDFACSLPHVRKMREKWYCDSTADSVWRTDGIVIKGT